MSPVRPPTPSPPKNILVAVLQGLGDLVLATPAIRQLHHRFPDARLTVAARPAFIDILCGEEYVSERIPVDIPAKGPLLQKLSKLWCVTREIRKRRFDLFVNLTTLLSLSTYVKCSVFNRLCSPRRLLANGVRDCLVILSRRERVRFRNTAHESHTKCRLIRQLGDTPRVAWPRLSVGRAEMQSTPIAPLCGGQSRLVGVAAGGAKQTHRWPVERFVECIRLLRQRGPLMHIVLLGDDNDRRTADQLRSGLSTNVYDLTGRCTTRQLPATLKALGILITNDSGLMHVAAAVGTPVIAIFGAGLPSRYAPLAPRSRARVLYRKPPCGPCLRNFCGHQNCLAWISPSQVARAALTLLQEQDVRPESEVRERRHTRILVGSLPLMSALQDRGPQA